MSAAFARRLEDLNEGLLAPVKPVVQAPSISGQLVFNTFRLALTTVFIVMLVAVLHPDLKQMVRSVLLKDFRTVVSTATGDLRSNGSPLTVVKVKTRDSLALEIYESTETGASQLFQRIDIPEAKDGYFSFNGEATNLAIDDIDGNGKLAIVAPSFDQNLVGHLNVYRYDPAAQSFQPANH